MHRSYLLTGLVPMLVLAGAAPLAASADESDEPPSEPWGLLALPGGDGIALTWQVPLSDGGSPILEYVVFRSTLPGAWAEIGRTPATDFVDAANAPSQDGLLVAYEVVAVNAAGASSPSMAIVFINDSCIHEHSGEIPPWHIHPDSCI